MIFWGKILKKVLYLLNVYDIIMIEKKKHVTIGSSMTENTPTYLPTYLPTDLPEGDIK